MADVESQGITASGLSERYGSIDSKKAPQEATDKLPLLLGYWKVCPNQLYRIGLTCYIAWFVIHRIADIIYIFSVDARFPEGLEHLYPSEAERLQSVSYTRQVLMCSMVHRVLIFCIVLPAIVFNGFGRMDAALRAFPAYVESSMLLGTPYTWCGNFKDHILYGRLATSISDTRLGHFAGHVRHGRLATDLINRFGFPLSIKELFVGGVYLSLIGALFYVLSAPFMYWRIAIDLKFGFANSLSVSLANFQRGIIASSISMLIMGVPKKCMFLAVLQYRFGWLLMWGGLIGGMIYSQHNVDMIAPMMGLNNKFPTSNFAVGRGFPLVHTKSPYTPWISLNRLFFPPAFAEALGGADQQTKFYTNDKSKGQLALVHKPSGNWAISGAGWFEPLATFASTSSSLEHLSGLPTESWSLGGENTRMGMRSGKELREKLFGFADKRNIGVGEIYMVDGSYKDARANAFVTGAGNHSIIGLYDTLFLGKRGAEATEDDADDDSLESPSVLEHVGEAVEGLDVEAEDQDRKAPRNSAPTQAMNDDEIVSILAHELAHSALKHMEVGMGAQLVTSFMTFATLGWMAHSPLAAAALMLTTPILHVGACAYEHVVGPPLDGFLKLFTDSLTRHNEYEADSYAALISEKYGTGLQTALAKLSVNSNQDPDPPFFFEMLHSDHPTFARRWKHIEEVKKKAYGAGEKKASGL